MRKEKTKIHDISRKVDEALLDITPQDWIPLSCPDDHPTPIKPLSWQINYYFGREQRDLVDTEV
ncbi:MAG: hypothetical protein ABSF48_21795, partial [Thermodesulfobacteriota bacterium]